MPRPPRIRLPGITFHVVQRGNDRNRTFFVNDDYRAYLNLLNFVSHRYETDVHAYVLMTNHVHLLMTSRLPDGVSRTMQNAAAGYSRRINERLERTGTLWEGRFRSSPIDSDYYALACYRYIELNPVRAGMVASPADYRWSSYHENTGRRSLSIVKPHASYLALGASPRDQRKSYRAIVDGKIPERDLDEFRFGARKGLPVGSTSFRRRIEDATGTKIGSGTIGRPRAKRKGL
jgi:putative transposase